MPKPPIPLPVVASPIIRRVAWHIRRVSGQLDRRFFIALTEGFVIIVAVARARLRLAPVVIAIVNAGATLASAT